MSTTHVNLKPVTLKNGEMFHNWQYMLKGALLLKKLWLLVTGIEKQPTVLPPQLMVKPDLPPLVAQAVGSNDVAAQAQAQAQVVQVTEHTACTLEATEYTTNVNMHKLSELQLDFNQRAGVALGLIFLLLDLSLKPLVVELESLEATYKAICMRYEPTKASQQMHIFTLFFSLKMEDSVDLHSHFDCINSLSGD
jgi:hypothetical protein